MTDKGVSDLILALTAFGLVILNFRRSPGLSIALILFGIAASLGVIEYVGIPEAAGPHAAATIICTAAGFPMLAFAVAAPRSDIARRYAGAGPSALFLGGAGLALRTVSVSLWGEGLAITSVAAICWSAFDHRKALAAIGGALLALSLFVAATPLQVQAQALAVGVGLSSAAILHVLIALGLTFVSVDSLLTNGVRNVRSRDAS